MEKVIHCFFVKQFLIYILFKRLQTNLHGFEALADCFGVSPTSVEIQHCLLSIIEGSRDVAEITPELQGKIQEVEQPAFPLLGLSVCLVPQLGQAGHLLLDC